MVVRGMLAVVIGLASAATAIATPSLNLAEATADVKAKMARGGQGNIILLGDSLTFDETFSFRPYFRDRLQAVYGDAGPGYLSLGTERLRFGAGWSAGTLTGTDPPPHHGLDGLWLKALQGNGSLPSDGVISTFWHDVKLHYVAEPGGGAVQLALGDGAAPIGRIDTNAATREVRTFEYRFPQDVATSIRFQPDGTGPVTLLGIDRLGDGPGLRVHRGSNGGWGVEHYLRRDWTFEQEINLLDADLIMLAIGANDANTPADQYVQRLDLLVDRLEAARPDAEILLVAPYDFGHPNAGGIAGAIEEVAAAHGAGLINLYETAGTYASFQQRGFLSDHVHFTEPGAEYVGGLLANAFRTNGANFAAAAAVPEPGATALSLGCAAAVLRRRPRRTNLPPPVAPG